jgi:hypothetical protein
MFELIYNALVVMGVITLVVIAAVVVSVCERIRRDSGKGGDENRHHEQRGP